jgi:hypothetical protein
MIAGSTAPWADSEGVVHPPFLIAKGFHAPAGDTGEIEFDFYDSPAAPATDVMELGPFPLDQVDSFEIEWDFKLYFAVRTKEDKNGSAQVYTQRAVKDWEFNGSGTIDVFQVWTQTGMGNQGTGAFAIITSGSRVPVTTGTPFNDVPQVFSSVPYNP